MTPGQEAIAVALPRMLMPPPDDLLVMVREFLNPAEPAIKTFKDDEPGFVHMDIKYLPQVPDEAARRDLFAAIDRATRWVFMRIYADQSEASGVNFLERLHESAPKKITKLLTDNGMVGRFNGRISEVVSPTRFASAAQLDATLDSYAKTYNHRIPLRALNHLSPVQALKKWQPGKPELFVRRVCHQPVLDKWRVPVRGW